MAKTKRILKEVVYTFAMMRADSTTLGSLAPGIPMFVMGFIPALIVFFAAKHAGSDTDTIFLTVGAAWMMGGFMLFLANFGFACWLQSRDAKHEVSAQSKHTLQKEV